jgi:ABC-type antimicrobial peptide transport system permease subunit
VDTLKSGSVNSGSTSPFFRKALVITQFTISISLLIGVLFIGKQVNYIRNKDIGFNKNNIVTIDFPDQYSEKRRLLDIEMSKLPQVNSISFSTSVPGTEDHWGTRMSEGGSEDPDQKSVTVILTDHRFTKLYGVKLLAGRELNVGDTSFISESIPSEQRLAKSLANVSLVKAMGYPSIQDAVGKKFWTGMGGYNTEIVGVVNDFNVASSREAVKPTLVTQDMQQTGTVGIKLNTAIDVRKVLVDIETAYKRIYPDAVFNYNFLDQRIDDLYKSEIRLFGLFRIFSGIAILISCLGLWGLISLTTTQRIREIGIRKVMGATVTDVVTLLTKDFILLVSLAIMIAIPLAYFGVHWWLQEFAFRIPMSAWVFIMAGLITISIALITVSFQAVRSAIVNPVKSLRSE